jgi:hypothetical protein
MAAGGAAEVALQLPGSTERDGGNSESAAAASPAAGSGVASPVPPSFPPRVVNIYAYAGRGTSTNGGAPSLPGEPQPGPHPTQLPQRSSEPSE